jgi:hypothetical protein
LPPCMGVIRAVNEPLNMGPSRCQRFAKA